MRGKIRTAMVCTVMLCVAACAGGSAGEGAPGASSQGQGVSDKVIKLGATLPLTGGAADNGKAFRAGMEAAIEEINEAGGINGRTLEMKVLDDGFQPARTVSNILRLLEQDKVFALNAPVGSAGIPGAYSMIERTGAPMFGPYLPPDPDLPSVFLLPTPHREQGEVMTSWLAGEGVKRVAFIGQDNEYGHAILDGVKEAAARDNVEVVEVALTETNSTNVNPSVLSAKRASPDALVLGTDNAQTTLVLKQVKQLGWDIRIVAGSSAAGTGSSTTVGPAGEAAEGLYGAAIAALPNSDTDAVKKYHEAMKKYRPDADSDNIYALVFYAQQQVFFEILRRMGNDLTWENFQKVSESLKSFETGLLPPITFGELPGGHTGSHGVIIAQYLNGKWATKTDFIQAG